MSWRDVGFLVVGLVVGANVGLLVLGLCHAARRGDELLMRPEAGDGGRETEDGGRGVVFERKVVISKRRYTPQVSKKPYTPPVSYGNKPSTNRTRIPNGHDINEYLQKKSEQKL